MAATRLELWDWFRTESPQKIKAIVGGIILIFNKISENLLMMREFSIIHIADQVLRVQCEICKQLQKKDFRRGKLNILRTVIR